jgi:hypothetical protein
VAARFYLWVARFSHGSLSDVAQARAIEGKPVSNFLQRDPGPGNLENASASDIGGPKVAE